MHVTLLGIGTLPPTSSAVVRKVFPEGPSRHAEWPLVGGLGEGGELQPGLTGGSVFIVFRGPDIYFIFKVLDYRTIYLFLYYIHI